MIPTSRTELDDHLISICGNSADTMEHAIASLTDGHTKTLTLPVLALINDALQKVRLAKRMLDASSHEVQA